MREDKMVGSPCSPRDPQESSPTPQFKNYNSSMPSFLYSPISHPCITTGKTITLTRRNFVGKVMSLFNMLSGLVIGFLPRSKHLLFSWLQSFSSAVILEPRKIKSDTVSPSVSHEVMGPYAMIFIF